MSFLAYIPLCLCESRIKCLELELLVFFFFSFWGSWKSVSTTILNIRIFMLAHVTNLSFHLVVWGCVVQTNPDTFPNRHCGQESKCWEGYFPWLCGLDTGTRHGRRVGHSCDIFVYLNSHTLHLARKRYFMQ